MHRHETLARRLVLVAIAVVGVVGATALAAAQEDDFFPRTKKLGQAAVQYKDQDIQVVAAYYHSQRNHDSRWLLIETAVSTTRNLTIDRGDVRLVTPGGREIPLPPQSRVLEDRDRISLMVQNASASRHAVLTYFPQRGWSERLRIFSLTSGQVLTNFVTDQYHVAHGDLFFESPTGLWERGTYSLVIERDGVRAVLPIELE